MVNLSETITGNKTQIVTGHNYETVKGNKKVNNNGKCR